MDILIPTKTKLFIFTRYQSSKIDIILRQNLNLARVLLYLCTYLFFFRVKKHSCKILKTKNCVPFEVQYYSNKSLFSLFLSASLVCRCSYVAYIANNTDPDQTASLVNISFHEKNLIKNPVCSSF